MQAHGTTETCPGSKFQGRTCSKTFFRQRIGVWIGQSKRPAHTVGFQEVEATVISRQSAHQGGKVVIPTHRPPLPQKIFLVVISFSGWMDPRVIVRPEGLSQLKIKTLIGNRDRDLPACSAMPQPTAPPRAPSGNLYTNKFLWYSFLLQPEWSSALLRADRRIKSLEKLQLSHRESNPRLPILRRNASTNCVTARPASYLCVQILHAS